MGGGGGYTYLSPTPCTMSFDTGSCRFTAMYPFIHPAAFCTETHSVQASLRLVKNCLTTSCAETHGA